jgi:addiction module HigA family antidote
MGLGASHLSGLKAAPALSTWRITISTLRKRPPTHPGAILREDVFPSLQISVSEFARHLGISRQTLHAVLSERSAVSPELALRLGAFLGNGPQLWMEMQSRYDLWQAERKLKNILPRIPAYSDLLAA